MHSVTKPFLALLFGTVGLPVLASSVFLRMDYMPYDAGRYTIFVVKEAQTSAGVKYTVTARLKVGKWPMRVVPRLSKIFQSPGQLTVYGRRDLKFKGSGRERHVTFTVSNAEARAWDFEVDEYGEVDGRLMPSITAYYFALNRPPQLKT